MALLARLGKYRNTGLLLIRLVLGFMFMLYGYPKLLGGPAMWTKVGSAMEIIGINFFPVGWGFAAAVVETFGGFLLILGLAFRPTCLLLFFVMLMASLRHLTAGDGIMGSAHAIELCVIFFGLALLGPGSYSVDKK